ncbi:MAG TPA: ATP-binding protein [Solirubrobacteraceae bacterium]
MSSHCDQFRLAPDKGAVRQARLRVRAFTELPREVESNAELVVSELVANSVLHARLGPGDLIDVRICRDDDRLQIEVADGGSFSGRTRHRPGLGFRVLDAVCDEWHVEEGCVRATIRIARPAPAAGPAARREGGSRLRLRTLGR